MERQTHDISTHTPLAGRDSIACATVSKNWSFLLTRPSRGATYEHGKTKRNNRISTHTPLAGRDAVAIPTIAAAIISTHTPLAGRDVIQIMHSSFP